LQNTLNKIAVVTTTLKSRGDNHVKRIILLLQTSPAATSTTVKAQSPKAVYVYGHKLTHSTCLAKLPFQAGLCVWSCGSVAAGARSGETTIKTCLLRNRLAFSSFPICISIINRAGIEPTSKRCHQAGCSFASCVASKCINLVQSYHLQSSLGIEPNFQALPPGEDIIGRIVWGRCHDSLIPRGRDPIRLHIQALQHMA